MKYAFSTLGLPAAPLPEVLRLAVNHGWAGIELRAHPEEPVHAGLNARQRAEVAGEFESAGIEVSAVAGYAQVARPGPDGPVVEEIAELARLAHDLGSRYVRVFPGGGATPHPEADATAARRLAEASLLAAPHGVRVLLETHDSHRRGADVARVLDSVDTGRPGALWDVLHTWLGGESPEQALKALGPHLAYVQVKDVASAEDLTPLPLGDGVLPLEASLRGLRTRGYEGWLCWEYEKRWFPEVRELERLLADGRAHLDALAGDPLQDPPTERRA